MITRSHRLWAVALGLWISSPGFADTYVKPPTLSTPSPAWSDTQAGPNAVPQRLDASFAPNQRVADAIARQLKQSGQLRRYNIDINFQDGLAELRGHVADAWQRDEVIRLVQGVPGVELVRDRLTVVGFAPVTHTQSIEPPQGIVPGPMPGRVQGGVPEEPTPIFQAPHGVPQGMSQPPRMPPYAWPSTAPYNNYSRVAYPTMYPQEAFPFIGPMYPFPKIPPGWRSVTLEWKDGFWWYGPTATGHDWWRIRYW